ncbi:GNAT family N-acetyltransferase [Rapidithrix thailandica]|uniref:GNAT family N-acetyltransferase n=1 Tax=Rapidithrix thailandica TaxID=413964 RepID=A0AAW9RX34_9BACT
MDTTNQEFQQLWAIYKEAFPSNERRSLQHQKKLLGETAYHFEPVKHQGNTCGLIGYWKFEDFWFIEHFALSTSERGRGTGSQYLKAFLEKCPVTVILEVELPDTPLAEKRIVFYERLGFRLNTFDYFQPSYQSGGPDLPLKVMSFPDLINAEMAFSLHARVYHTEPSR